MPVQHTQGGLAHRERDVSCRFRPQGRFYAEFASRNGPVHGRPKTSTSASATAEQHFAAADHAEIVHRVAAAARAVLGAEVGTDQPLVAAGLDSLGAGPQAACGSMHGLSRHGARMGGV
jgi:hypothetical protein